MHDPTSVLREGDIVRIAAGWRVSRRKRHVVTEVVAAFGKAVEERAGLETTRGEGGITGETRGRGGIAGEGEGQGRGEEKIERRGLVGLEELVREREERREAKRERREGRRRERVGCGEGEAEAEVEAEGGSGEGR